MPKIHIQNNEKEYYAKSYAKSIPMRGYRQLDWQSLNANRKFIHEVKKLGQKLKGNKVLDLGCGIGRLAIPLAKSGFDVYGIDFAASAIQRARFLAHKEKVTSNARFRVGNVLSLPYPKSFFDLVLDYGCLHHIYQKCWDLYLTNIVGVLKPGGYLLLYTHGMGSKFYKTNTPKDGIKEFVVENVLTHFFEKDDFKKLFGKYFTIIFSRLGKHPATKNKRMWTVLLKLNT